MMDLLLIWVAWAVVGWVVGNEYVMPLLVSRQWVRRHLGGRWARVTGRFGGTRWVSVSWDCREQVEEDWG